MADAIVDTIVVKAWVIMLTIGVIAVMIELTASPTADTTSANASPSAVTRGLKAAKASPIVTRIGLSVIRKSANDCNAPFTTLIMMSDKPCKKGRTVS
jgi:hypothetical protein